MKKKKVSPKNKQKIWLKTGIFLLHSFGFVCFIDSFRVSKKKFNKKKYTHTQIVHALKFSKNEKMDEKKIVSHSHYVTVRNLRLISFLFFEMANLSIFLPEHYNH